MTLVSEHKLADFISPPKGSGVLEASGVVAKGAHYYVIFDNIRRVARIHRGLKPGSKAHGWFGRARDGEGYEDITFSPRTRRFYLLIEAEKHPDGTYKALIDECDEAAQFKKRRWVDFPFEKRNTGFEGLAAVRVGGHDYLLALCEGNRCRAGRKGRKPGGGRIHVLQRKGTLWQPVARIKLPRSVKFMDYSATRAARHAHCGRLANERALVDWDASSRATGRSRGPAGYTTFRSGKGKAASRSTARSKGCGGCRIGRSSWCSDLSKAHYPGICHKTDQSIFVFKTSRRVSKRSG